VSPDVQALPSSQGAALAAYTQPPSVTQLSVVHTFPSSHVRAGPPVQTAPTQMSSVVQVLLSLQAPPVLFV
jgi:hypothetical protein